MYLLQGEIDDFFFLQMFRPSNWSSFTKPSGEVFIIQEICRLTKNLHPRTDKHCVEFLKFFIQSRAFANVDKFITTTHNSITFCGMLFKRKARTVSHRHRHRWFYPKNFPTKLSLEYFFGYILIHLWWIQNLSTDTVSKSGGQSFRIPILLQ